MNEFPVRGGKGQKFTPGITHVRVPVPLKELVLLLVNEYKRLYGKVTDPEGKALIRRVEDVIVLQQCVNGYQSEAINVNGLKQDLLKAQEEADQLRSQLASVQDQLQNQAAKAGEWYEKAKALQDENAQLRSQLASRPAPKRQSSEKDSAQLQLPL